MPASGTVILQSIISAAAELQEATPEQLDALASELQSVDTDIWDVVTSLDELSTKKPPATSKHIGVSKPGWVSCSCGWQVAINPEMLSEAYTIFGKHVAESEE